MRRFWQAYTALREHSYVSFAKIATVGGFCNTDILVIKATSPDDLPVSERYIHELLKAFSISPTSFRAFSLSFTRRFGKTRCWRVALKCLVLLHRLLRSLPENSPFRKDFLWCRSNGLISLYPCHFEDSSSTAFEDYTTFIRSYARLLDEALDCFSFNSTTTTKDGELSPLMGSKSLSEKMKEVSRVLEVLPQFQSLIDRVMDCKPTGVAARSFLVLLTMKQIIRDSFNVYASIGRDLVVVLDNLLQMQYRSSISAFGIYKRATIQVSQLSEFYDWCKSMGLCGSYEYPFIDKIPQLQVRALEVFLDGMWQLTESSSSSVATSPLSTTTGSPPSTEDHRDKRLARLETVISTKWQKFEDDEEEPLIQLDVELNNNVGWEALLEASAGLLPIPRDTSYFYPKRYEYGYRCNTREKYQEESNSWDMQVYNPNAFNPFYQPYITPNYHGEECTTNNTYPWGL